MRRLSLALLVAALLAPAGSAAAGGYAVVSQPGLTRQLHLPVVSCAAEGGATVASSAAAARATTATASSAPAIRRSGARLVSAAGTLRHLFSAPKTARRTSAALLASTVRP